MKSKFTRIALAGALLLAILPAHAEDEKFLLDQNGCRIVNPFPRADETATWTGGCKDGLVDGTGVLQWTHVSVRVNVPSATATIAHDLLSDGALGRRRSGPANDQ